jgi:hypothetical protein
MNRCKTLLLAVLVLGGIGLSAFPAAAQTEDVKPNVRQFPKTAVRGLLVIGTAPEITMNGKADRMSPGVRIRDANNNLVLSSTFSGQKLVVNYVRDNTGLVHQVWVLNTEEERQKIAGKDEGILSNIRSIFETKPITDDGKTPFDKLPVYKP